MDSDDKVFRYGSVALIVMFFAAGFLVIYEDLFSAFAEEFKVEISDGISVGDSDPKTNFANLIILKYNLISYFT